MMLVELTTVPNTALPVAEFKEHLRLGTGFAEDTLQDSVLESFLKAAIAAVEGRTGKALLVRQFIWSLTRWREPSVQALPIAPVNQIISVRVVDGTGSSEVVHPTQYRLYPDMQRPKLATTSLALPTIPWGGSAEITFDAGYGAAWGDVPADLAQAILLLAAHYYEHRHAVTSSEMVAMPFGVSALIERYRSLSINLGARR